MKPFIAALALLAAFPLPSRARNNRTGLALTAQRVANCTSSRCGPDARVKFACEAPRCRTGILFAPDASKIPSKLVCEPPGCDAPALQELLKPGGDGPQSADRHG
ncbi:MAG TPA: hypothetical protein VLV17_01735 [Anaeromyxobacteraceae bacterium]|nr:hypothetical protein [Anaeromyxobacteraceae bacterium]